MLLFPQRSVQGFYFPVLSRIENCQYPFSLPQSSQDLSMCNHCWLDSPFSGTQLCCLNAHPGLPASFKCFTGSCFYSSQSELHITSNVPLQKTNQKKSTKKNTQKNPPKPKSTLSPRPQPAEEEKTEPAPSQEVASPEQYIKHPLQNR